MPTLYIYLNDDISGLNSKYVSNIYVGSDGKLHKVIGGADTVLPFNSGVNVKNIYLVNFISFGLSTTYSYVQNSLTVGKDYLVIIQGYCNNNSWGWATSNPLTFSNVSSSASIVIRQGSNSSYQIQSAAYRITPSATSCIITANFGGISSDYFCCSLYILGF